jgi:hypothetical protein
MQSTHIVDLHLPDLPPAARTAHLFPALGDTSLISIGQLCDAGCTAVFTATEVHIHLHNKVIIQGTRSLASNRLWTLDLPDSTTDSALAAYPHSACPADLVAFAHASLFSPVTSTLMQALKKNFITIPGLNSKTLAKYPPVSVATHKGHLDQSRQHQQSTRDKTPAPTADDILEELLFPNSLPNGERTHFCYASCIDTTGKIFTDQTGRFPLPSSQGNTQLLVLYDYDSNFIHAEPMKTKSAASILNAYKKALAVFIAAGLRPVLQRLDNEASVILKQHMREEHIDFQLVPPGVHRRNAAERAIRTFKNHFIAGLCSTDADFPLHLWDKLLPQALLSLNLLRGSRLNPKLSAWAQVHGPYDFNRTPIGPPGVRVLVHEKPSDRRSWSSHGVDGWYIGPALDSYRCYSTWVWYTRSERIADTLSWFPQHLSLPIASSTDLIAAGVRDILNALANPSPASSLAPLSPSEVQTLETLSEILLNRLPPVAAPPLTDPTVTAAPIPAPPVTAPPVTAPPIEASPVAAPPAPDPAATAPPVPTPPVPGTQSTTPPVVAPAATAPPAPPATPLRVPASPLRVPAPAPQETPTTTEADTWTLVPKRRRRKPHTKHPSAPIRRRASPRLARRPRTRSRSHRHGPVAQLATETAPPATGTYATSDATTLAVAQALLCELAPLPNTAQWLHPSIPISTQSTEWMESALKAIHPDTGNPAEYPALVNSSEGDLWKEACSEEIGRLAQGYKETDGTNTIHFISLSDIPAGRKATYLRNVVADRPQKAQTRRVRWTVGGDRIQYPGDVSTKCAGLATAKILFNSVLSTPQAKFMCLDIKDFYLNNDMQHYEYMKIAVSAIPQEVFDAYQLSALVHHGHVYVEIRKGMYGLPQAGRIANDALVPYLAQNGYHQLEHTPGLFKHETRPILFSLVVDDFGVQYTGTEHAQHLVDVIAAKYKMTTDWTGSLYCGITLDWDYTARTVDLSMPGYITKALARFEHPKPSQPQHAPSAWSQPVYSSMPQLTPQTDTSEPLNKSEITRLQEIIGVLLYYSRAIDSTMLVALGTLASAQTHGTQSTMKAATHLLNYAATHPNATLRYHASDMLLEIHSDASYLSAPKARSRAGGLHFLGNKIDTSLPNAPPATPNGAIHVLSNIMRNVLASATEAEVGALFHNAQDGCVLRNTLIAMGWPQQQTPIQTDNSCAEGIINDTVKQRRSKAIDMRFYWVRDRVRQGQFRVHWKKGEDNRADYFTKHHSPKHHRQMRSTYLHETTNNK